MMKNIAIAAGLMFLAHTGLAFAGDKMEKTEETTSADGAAVKTKKSKKTKKNMDGSATTTTESKTEVTK